MARTAPTTRQPAALEDEPPLDPEAISRAYLHHRARRAAKQRRHREKRWAGVRFWFVLALVLVRIISIPDDFFFASRGLGIWISLACAVAIILAGLLEASEEL